MPARSVLVHTYMCGIAGFLGATGDRPAESCVTAMTDAIAHRGPDADGAWCDVEAGISLGHRRLSIVDLSPTGAQPMASASGRYVIAFNGEAYNYAGIRAELVSRGATFRGHSDTEVLLAAFEVWGIEASVPRFAGMFALAVWDREERTLWLVRDRLGEKPLYVGQCGSTWLFGSELKALRAFPGFTPGIDIAAVTQLLRHGYIQAPQTIYEGIRKVRPGTILRLRAGEAPVERVYWSADAQARAGLADPIRGSMEEVVSAVEQTLLPVVQDEMMADVPLGAFLSGGVDSSLIVALMQAQATRPVRTFTIGFDDPRFDESGFARDVAAHLGTEHTEMIVQGDDALAFVTRLPELYDEPMADASQLPTLLVSRLTRQHVTVALSGDGGDELFGGYQHHRARGLVDRMSTATPALLRGALGGVLRQLPDPLPASLVRAVTGPDAGRPANTLSRLGEMLSAADEREAFATALSLNVEATRLLHPDHRARAGSGMLTGPWLGGDRPFESRMLFDALTFLPDDVLVKVDRAAMAFSLETRAPLLDHRIFELAWRIPYEQKVVNGVGKQPLRHLLDRYVPRALIDRPKRGFTVPMAAWLRGPLRPWADSLVSGANAGAGVLDMRRVRQLWAQHTSGVADHSASLWPVLSLLQFLEATASGHTSAPVRLSA